MDAYLQFLKNKVAKAPATGFDPLSPPHPSLFGHQRDICQWLARGGRRACFANFGLGKTRMQLQTANWVVEKTGGKYLIVAPLGVRGEFTNSDGPALGLDVRYVRTDAESEAEPCKIQITNYDRVRDGQINVAKFSGAGLDEGDALRSFGSLTFQSFLKMFTTVKYKYVFTATPSPNRFKELIHYSAWLSVLDSGDALTRFFQRDSQKAGNLTLMPHQEEHFYYWLSTWAVFLLMPSDLGYSNEGYEMPPFEMHWHRLEEDYKQSWANTDSWGQFQLLPTSSAGLQKAATCKRNSIELRANKVIELLDSLRQSDGSMSDQAIVWCDLNFEQDVIEKMLKNRKITFTSLRGSQGIDERETMIEDWKSKKTTVFLSKSQMYGAGANLQQCATMIYCGINYKARDFMQAIHRIVRYGQKKVCHIHAVYLESEDKIKDTLEFKMRNHNDLQKRMSDMVRENHLANISL